jgi:hypothetical protein
MADEQPVQQAAVAITHVHVKTLSLHDLLNSAYFIPPVGPLPWSQAVRTWARHDVIHYYGL